MPNDCFDRLSDADLVARVKDLTGRVRRSQAELIAHLAELDTRDIHLREGYSSIFAYCVEALGFSEHEAYHRIEAARAARRFPVVLGLLAEGALNLTTVKLLGRHLTAENHLAVLESARGKTKAQVEQIVASLAPRPDAPAMVRRLPVSEPRPQAPIPQLQQTTARPASLLAPEPPRPAAVAALSPDRYRLQLTISGDILEKLRLAKDMLRHAVPSGDDEAVLDRALTALLSELARTKFAAAENPRERRDSAPDSRHVPAEVKRAVWVRDRGRCAFVGVGGHRCNERAFVEFHHLAPHAAGGPATERNIALRCRRHNQYEADVYFGAAGGMDRDAVPLGPGRVAPAADSTGGIRALSRLDGPRPSSAIP